MFCVSSLVPAEATGDWRRTDRDENLKQLWGNLISLAVISLPDFIVQCLIPLNKGLNVNPQLWRRIFCSVMGRRKSVDERLEKLAEWFSLFSFTFMYSSVYTCYCYAATHHVKRANLS